MYTKNTLRNLVYSWSFRNLTALGQRLGKISRVSKLAYWSTPCDHCKKLGAEETYDSHDGQIRTVFLCPACKNKLK